MYRDLEAKVQTVLSKNTFFFIDPRVQEEQEQHISSLVQLILLLKAGIEEKGLKKRFLVEFIMKKSEGLAALLAILGISDETMNRLLMFIKEVNNPELNQLVNRKFWPKREMIVVKDLPNYFQNNKLFAEGIINLLFEGATIPILRNSLPLFELKKFNITKFKMSPEALIDTIVRYKVKGSFMAKAVTNPEKYIKDTLTEWDIKWEEGRSLREKIGRDVDVMIPSKESPIIIIECSYHVTTSSGMGDKAANELRVRRSIKEQFGEGVWFVGFIDGLGWYVRRSDLRVLVQAFDEVFTFHREEIERFKAFLQGNLTEECYI